MASSLIGALRVSLGLDSAEFTDGTKRARKEAKDASNDIVRSFKSVASAGSVVKGAVAGFFAIETVQAITSAAKAGLEYASSLAEVAQQLGVTTRDLQEYRYVASQVGVSQDEMDKSLSKLTKTIGEAIGGGKKQSEVFKELGISLKDSNGNIITAGAAIPKISDALAKVASPAERARIETELFGKAGQKLDPLLSGGSKAINELRDAAQRLGLVISDDSIQKADATADKLSELKQVLEANIASVVANNATAIAQLAQTLFDFAGAALQATNAWIEWQNSQARTRQIQTENEGRERTDHWWGTVYGPPTKTPRPKGGRTSGRAPMGDAGRLIPTVTLPKAPETQTFGSGGGGGKKGRSGSSGPTLAEQYADLRGRLLPEKGALEEYQKELELIDKIGKAGLATQEELAELRRAAGKDLLDRTGIEEAPIMVLELNKELEVTDETIKDLPQIKLIDPDQVRLMEQWSQGFKHDIAGSLADAVVYGENLGDVLVNSFKRAAAAFIESKLLQYLDKIGNPSGEDGGGGFFGKLLSIGRTAGSANAGASGGGGFFGADATYVINNYQGGLGDIQGFATGGSFKVGGVSGRDRNLVSFRASKGEMVSVTKGSGGRSNMPLVFDLRGAVMTQDLLDQMNAIGRAAAIGGANLSRAAHAKAQRKQL